MMRIIIVLLLAGAGFFSCKAQSPKFQYMDLPPDMKQAQEVRHAQSVKDLQARKASIQAKAFRAETRLPADWKSAGQKDYTALLQQLINEYKYIILPDGPLWINEKGLQMPSHSALIFQPNTVLKMRPNALEKYSVIGCRHVEDVYLFDPVIIGDRDQHQGQTGEWGMGIGIWSSDNVTVVNPKVSKCWGDGIYIGRVGVRHPTNIHIIGGHMDYNRRNGISIITGRNIKMENMIVSNTFGTMPMSGVDVEPNTNEDVLENIHILHLQTFNNTRRGLLIDLGNFIGTQQQQVQILVRHHRDELSGESFGIGGTKKQDPSWKKLKGQILVEDTRWNGQVQDMIVSRSLEYAPIYHLRRFQVGKQGQTDKIRTREVQRQLKSLRIKTSK